MRLRKVIKTRSSFPSEEAALKLLYMGLKNVAKKWSSSRAGARRCVSRFCGRSGCRHLPAAEDRQSSRFRRRWKQMACGSRELDLGRVKDVGEIVTLYLMFG